MTTTATGPNGLAMQKLATLLSTVSAWQTRCGVSTSANALKFIHYPHFRDTDQSKRPIAIISRTPDGGFNARRDAGGGKNWFLYSGTLRLIVVDDLKDFTDEKDPDIDFHNFTESLITGLLDGAAVSDALAISDITATIPPSRSDDTTVAGEHATNAIYSAEWLISWDQC